MNRAVAIALAGVLALACGYRPVSGVGPAGEPERRIEISLFENESSEPGFERMLADALVEEFARRGQFVPVYEGADIVPDLALRGVVRSVRIAPSSFSSVGLALENRVEVVLSLELRAAGRPEARWSTEKFGVDEIYLASADAQVQDTHREQALRRVASEVAVRIHDAVAQSF